MAWHPQSPTCLPPAPFQTPRLHPSPGCTCSLFLVLLTPGLQNPARCDGGKGTEPPQAAPQQTCLMSVEAPGDSSAGCWSGGKTSRPPTTPACASQRIHTTGPGHLRLAFLQRLQSGTSMSRIVSHPDFPCFMPELVDQPPGPPGYPGCPDFSLPCPVSWRWQAGAGWLPTTCCPFPPGHKSRGPVRL